MIRTVAEISKATADAIRGTEYSNGMLYNPIQDANGNWVISLQTAQFLDRSLHYFSVIDWVAPLVPEIETPEI